MLIGQGMSVAEVGTKTAYIAPGSPWENGFVESFTARRRDELLDGEIFYSLREAQILIESWRRHYNTVRPHGADRWRQRSSCPPYRLASCPHPTGSAGQATRGAKANRALTLRLDHPMGADQTEEPDHPAAL
ncbi:hypothetical protein AwMethylo_17880 [Methylobacterium sp.]|nr:hypothetical protein AwMethylo_17880 [Methylobacterium sp.]